MNFAHHGPMNSLKGAKRTFGLATVYPHCIGAFSYYTRKVLERVGLMDENFVNAYEHVHHTWRIANHNFTTPFWYFADHPQSHLMLEEIPGSISNSSIRIREDWQTNIGKAKEYWIKKHGFFLPPFPREFYTKSNGTIQS
jgi:GT2 family glycosyltransferase